MKSAYITLILSTFWIMSTIVFPHFYCSQCHTMFSWWCRKYSKLSSEHEQASPNFLSSHTKQRWKIENLFNIFSFSPISRRHLGRCYSKRYSNRTFLLDDIYFYFYLFFLIFRTFFMLYETSSVNFASAKPLLAIRNSRYWSINVRLILTIWQT